MQRELVRSKFERLKPRIREVGVALNRTYFVKSIIPSQRERERIITKSYDNKRIHYKKETDGRECI